MALPMGDDRLTVKEAVELTGYSEVWIRKCIASGDLPAHQRVKYGKVVLSRRAVIEWASPKRATA